MENDWDPFVTSESSLSSVHIRGVDLELGDRVRISPRKRADIFDMALSGKIGVIEAIEQDFENQIHLAIVLDEDPGREFGLVRQPGHRFFFSPEEVEPIDPTSAQ